LYVQKRIHLKEENYALIEEAMQGLDLPEANAFKVNIIGNGRK